MADLTPAQAADFDDYLNAHRVTVANLGPAKAMAALVAGLTASQHNYLAAFAAHAITRLAQEQPPAAGSVQFAEVIAALRNEEAYRSWYHQHRDALEGIDDSRYTVEVVSLYLADRFGATPQAEAAVSKSQAPEER